MPALNWIGKEKVADGVKRLIAFRDRLAENTMKNSTAQVKIISKKNEPFPIS